MPALAYVLLPVSGAIAYFVGASARARFHGLQAILYGAIWAVVLYGCARLSDKATQAAFAVGTAGWLVLVVATAVGADPRLPLIGKWLKHEAEAGPRAGFESSEPVEPTDAG